VDQQPSITAEILKYSSSLNLLGSDEQGKHMSKYLVRIELHHASEADYAVLHAAMLRKGFLRTIPADDGTLYQLPTAEYYCESEFGVTRIHNLAEAAATETKKVSWVLVTQFVAASFRLDSA
jgi:hypothetical protein